MNQWTNVFIHKKDVEEFDEKNYKVWLPDNSSLFGCFLKYPKKLIRPLRNNKTTVSMGYTMDSKFLILQKTRGEIIRNEKGFLKGNEIEMLFTDIHRERVLAVARRV